MSQKNSKQQFTESSPLLGSTLTTWTPGSIYLVSSSPSVTTVSLCLLLFISSLQRLFFSMCDLFFSSLVTLLRHRGLKCSVYSDNTHICFSSLNFLSNQVPGLYAQLATRHLSLAIHSYQLTSISALNLFA